MKKEEIKKYAAKTLQTYKDKILGIDDYDWGQERFMKDLDDFIEYLIDKSYEAGEDSKS
jgi:hypothetical protein